MSDVRRATVLLADDHAIVAEGIATLLRSELTVVGTVGDGNALVKAARELRPDVVVADVGMPGLSGLDALRQLKAESHPAKFVLLTMHADPELAAEAFRAGASAFLVKSAAGKELITSIREVLLGRTYLTPLLARDAPPRPTGPRTRPFAARDVRRQLEHVLGSSDFDAPSRSRQFLRFVLEETVAGRADTITQSAIATHVFGRKEDFDALVDPIVRIQAGRLRRSLERYYLLSGRADAIRIELPKGTYVPVFHGGAAVGSEVKADTTSAAEGTAGDWPAVVLTGLEPAVASPEARDLATRVSDELAFELGRYRILRVLRQGEGEVAPSLAAQRARFSLGGRLRHDGDHLRISARLTDRSTGEQVWGDEYQTAPDPGPRNASPEDVARVIAARVGAEEGVVVQFLAAERRKAGRPASTPYDAILLSYEFFRARDPKSLHEALKALRRVVDAEPECGPAWIRLARLCLANYAFEVTTITTPIDEAITYAQQGVRVDPASRNARCILASALLVKGELAAAREELEQALRSSPDSLVYLEIIGYLLTLLGDWERGAALSRNALERNPHCLPHVGFGMWADSLRRGELGQAYQIALEYADRTFYWRGVMRGSCLGLLGRVPEAKAEVAQIIAQKPDFATRGKILIGHYIKFPEVMSRIVDGLARAGLDLE